jgi:hypothetical protein
MRIVKSYNTDENKCITKDIQEVYKAVISEETRQGDKYDALMVERFISWLPSIVEVEMCISYDNEWLNITFSNHEKITGLYNTGIEDGLHMLFETQNQ